MPWLAPIVDFNSSFSEDLQREVEEGIALSMAT
jgi:hypothetical protein